jgi:3-oxoacyl-[acyl-carrier protein] reductase
MDLNLQGKVVFVTGSTRGIGREIARGFATEGCTVVVHGRDIDCANLVAASIGEKAVAVSGDLRSSEVCHKILDDIKSQVGGINALVCNIGVSSVATSASNVTGEWHEMLDQNLLCAVNIVDASREELVRQSGVVTCVSSICGRAALPGAPVSYSAAKAALNAYVRGMARPLGGQGVRINAVAPGNIMFPGSVWEKKIQQDPDGVDKMLKDQVPLGRFGSPKEIADVIIFLTSDKAAFVTGSLIDADGGQSGI